MLIKDTNQKVRSLRATVAGMNPAVAEVYAQRGIDPRDHMEARRERLRSRHSFSRARPETLKAKIARMREEYGDDAKLWAEFALDASDVRVRQLVQRAALAPLDVESIADRWCPPVPTDVSDGEYKIEDRVSRLRQHETRVGDRGRAAQLARLISAGTFKCETRSSEATVNPRAQREAPAIENRMIAAQQARNDLDFQKEIEDAGTLFTSGSYAGANTKTVSSGAQWNGGGAADPIDDCQDAVAGCVIPPTHAVMSDLTWNAVTGNDELRSIVGAGGLPSMEQFATFWGLDGVEASRREYYAEGASTPSRIYGSSSIAFLHVSDDPEQHTFMRRWVVRQGAGGYVAIPYDKKDEGGYGMFYEKLTVEDVTKVVTNTCGFLLINVRQ